MGEREWVMNKRASVLVTCVRATSQHSFQGSEKDHQKPNWNGSLEEEYNGALRIREGPVALPVWN
jgi:hypothetical protein